LSQILIENRAVKVTFIGRGNSNVSVERFARSDVRGHDTPPGQGQINSPPFC